jgi:hypothetical protein
VFLYQYLYRMTVEKSGRFNNNFPSQGFALESTQDVGNMADEAIDLLLKLTGDKTINSEKPKLEVLENLLTAVFERDKEEYVGLLKGFANTPLIQSFATATCIREFAKKCGVFEPTLVTSPILHVVSEKLIINRDKVFTPPHQDVISTKGSVGQIVVWIPLHRIDSDNFGIRVNPGSHLLGTLPTAESSFGHTVDQNYLPELGPEVYLNMQKGDVCMFSQYLVHRTHEIGKFRIAISFRLNDLSDEDWRNRKYYVPFGRSTDDVKYVDERENSPTDSSSYFLS